MKYFCYHRIAQKRIQEGLLIGYEFVNKWNKISPALVLYFLNFRPMPIRKEKWNFYLELIKKFEKENQIKVIKIKK